MSIHRSEARKPGRRARGALALGCAAAVALATAGCDSLLDVENPNNVKQEDLENSTSATALANGALGTVTRGIIGVWGPYSTASDEVIWIGSRNAWNSLNTGFVADPFNEFTDAAFHVISEGRWMADEAIRLIEGFQADGSLDDPMNLVRAYVAGAAAYITLADQFDDYVFSNKKESGTPVGPDNMDDLYNTALGYIDNAIAITDDLVASDAEDEEAASMRTALYMLRARAHHGLGVWKMMNEGASPPPANPWVSSDAMAAAAGEVLGDIGISSDSTFKLDPDNQDVAVANGEVSLPYNVNQRPELQIGPEYVELSGDQTEILGVAIMDPIDDKKDPAFTKRLNQFLDGGSTSPYTLASAREMHLLLAEHALANGDTDGAVTHINHVRDMDDLTPYDETVHPVTEGVEVGDMLRHERRVNLFLQGRRLADMYRFGIADSPWQGESEAMTSPGTFFPITIVECRANPNLGEDFCGG